MTRSSNKGLVTPYEELERVLHSTRKLFKTTSLDYSSSSKFDLFSDPEDQFEKENTETMGQFLKELHDNTCSGSDNEDTNEHIERVLEIADLFTIPDVTQDQLMVRIFPISLTRAASLGMIQGAFSDMSSTLLDQYAGRGRYRAAAPGFYQRDHGNPSYQERRQTMENKFMAEFAKRHDENSNLIKENSSFNGCCNQNQGASIKALEIQIGEMRKVLQERGSGRLPSSTETNPRDHVKSISTCEETKTPSIRRIGSHQYCVSSQQKDDKMPLMELNQATVPFPGLLREYGYDKEKIKTIMNSSSSIILDNDMPRKEKDPGSFTLPCYINNMSFNIALVELGASVSVIPYLTFTNLGLGELAPKLIIELADRNMKRPKGIAENVLVGIDKFVFPVDFIVLDMPEDIKVPLILKRPFLSTAHAKIDVFKRSEDPKFVDFLELNDLNEPLELSRNQEVDNLGPTIKEGEFINKPMVDIVKTSHDDENIEGIDEYLSVQA
ncbi:DNA/RNA polymerases superfamily protein [Tanacetum coccineum]